MYTTVCMLSQFGYVQLFATPWTVAHQAPLYMGFSRQEYWSGLPCPPPGDLPSLGIKPGSPTLQADFLLFESPGKPKNTGVDSLSLLQGIFPTQESNRGLLHCTQILYQLSYQGSQNFKWPLYSGIIGCNTFYLLLLLRFQDILNVSFWKLKEIILLTFPERMLPLKKPIAAMLFHGPKEYFPE